MNRQFEYEQVPPAIRAIWAARLLEDITPHLARNGIRPANYYPRLGHLPPAQKLALIKEMVGSLELRL